MKTTDSDQKRIGAREEPHRLDAHPEPKRLEGHPEAGCLPPHKETSPKAAAAATEQTAGLPVEPTSDIQEARGVFGNAARVALGILAAIIVAAILLWRPGMYDHEPQTAMATPTMTTHQGYRQALASDGTRQIPVGMEVTESEVEEIVNSVAAGQKPAMVVVYLFNTDSSNIPETATLTSMADAANKTGKTVVIKAYTDETGRPEYNQQLSERRAKAVGEYMKAHGVAPNKINAKGYGPTHVYADNSLDRRAEVSLK